MRLPVAGDRSARIAEKPIQAYWTPANGGLREESAHEPIRHRQDDRGVFREQEERSGRTKGEDKANSVPPVDAIANSAIHPIPNLAVSSQVTVRSELKNIPHSALENEYGTSEAPSRKTVQIPSKEEKAEKNDPPPTDREPQKQNPRFQPGWGGANPTFVPGDSGNGERTEPGADGGREAGDGAVDYTQNTLPPKAEPKASDSPSDFGQKIGQIDLDPSKSNHLQGNAQSLPNPEPTVLPKAPKANSNFGQKQNKNQLWFRFELDIREVKSGGHMVRIRKRLRWSTARYSRTIAKKACPDLTKKMVKQIQLGRFSQETIAALQNGGLDYGLVAKLSAREGRGSGRRASELTNDERRFLARLEHGLAAGGRRRDAKPDSGTQRPMDLSDSDLSGSQDADVTRVPYVH